MPAADSAAGWAAFEEGGALVVLRIERANERTFRLADGRKIPRQRAWLVLPEYGGGAAKQARRLAARIDAAKLRERAGGEEVEAAELGAMARDGCCGGEGSGGEYSETVWQLAALQTALENPAYFHRGRGKLRPASEQALASALADAERKSREREHRAELAERLRAGETPKEIVRMRDAILAGTAKNSVAATAVQKVAGKAPEAVARFFVERGLLRDARDYWRAMFLAAWPADAVDDSGDGGGVADAPQLPLAAREAFSIDDAGTFEVDDAFSARRLEGGLWRIGVHIAAPALGIAGGGAEEVAAFAKMTSVYFPDEKRPMLTKAALEKYSLRIGAGRPALSAYFDFDESSGGVCAGGTVLESLALKASFTPEEMEGDLPEDVAEEYAAVCAFAAAQPDRRPRREGGGRERHFVFSLDPPAVRLRPRSPASFVVEAMMRLVNCEWGRRLAESKGGLFRRDGATKAKPESGGDCYAWLSSPLRRYADLANQRFLLSLLRAEGIVAVGGCGDGEGDDALLPDWKKLSSLFDARYARAKQYQRIAERHWALCALERADGDCEGELETDGNIRRVRLKEYPLTGKISVKNPGAAAYLSRLSREAKERARRGEDALTVTVKVRPARVDLFRQLVMFDLAEIPQREKQAEKE